MTDSFELHRGYHVTFRVSVQKLRHTHSHAHTRFPEDSLRRLYISRDFKPQTIGSSLQKREQNKRRIPHHDNPG